MGQRSLIVALVALLLAPATAGAATVAVEDGVLHVVGTASAERIDFDQLLGGNIEVSVSGSGAALAAGSGCVQRSTSEASCSPLGVVRALVELGDGDDEYLPSRFTLPARAEGGPGDDTLYDAPGADELSGGEGDDLLWMDSGPDADADVVSGGPGYDRASYGQWRGSDGPLRLSIDDVANDGIPGEGDNIRSDVEALNGGHAGDVLVGSPGDDELGGGGGDDELDGGGGDDLLDGGEGADRLNGGDGLDAVDYSWYSGPVLVTLDGLAGDGWANENDLVGGDVEGAIGGSGNDTLIGNAGDGLLVGMEGDDRIVDPGGQDLLVGDEGDDQIEAADGAADEVDCGDGSDRAWRDAADAVGGDCESVTAGPRGPEPEATPTPTPTPRASPTPRPRPTPPPRATFTPASRPPADTTPPSAALLRVASQARAATLRRRGLSLTFRCNEVCRASAVLRGRGGTLASGALHGLSAGERHLRLRLNKTGRRKLRAGRLQISLTLIDRAGNSTSVVRSLGVR